MGRPTASVTARAAEAESPLNVTVVVDVSNNDGSTWSGLSDIGAGTANAAPTGALIRVRVNATHSQLSGFFPFLNNLTLREEAIMRREPS